MINLLLKIVLLISLFFNITLYFGLIDVGQYKKIVDSGIEKSQQYINSENLNNLWDGVTKNFSGNVQDLKKETIKTIKEDGTEQAKKLLEGKLKNLNKDEIKEIVDKTEKEINNSK